MLTRDEFDDFCQKLPGTSHVVQWGNASVWKVGGKIFAIMPDREDGGMAAISFKASDIAFEALPAENPGVVPAPYLARVKWLQVREGAMDNNDIRDYITHAHKLVGAKLTKKMQRELGLIP